MVVELITVLIIVTCMLPVELVQIIRLLSLTQTQGKERIKLILNQDSLKDWMMEIHSLFKPLTQFITSIRTVLRKKYVNFMLIKGALSTSNGSL